MTKILHSPDPMEHDVDRGKYTLAGIHFKIERSIRRNGKVEERQKVQKQDFPYSRATYVLTSKTILETNFSPEQIVEERSTFHSTFQT